MIPTRIGQKFEGGYFAGINRIGVCAYAILVAPKSTERNVQFKTTYSSTSGIQSVNDGWSNTNAMNDVEHPAAQYCRSLTVGRHADLYLPSRDELELCYRNLKPTARHNATYTAGTFDGNLGLATGTNLNSIPAGSAYTATNPTQTIVTAFWTGGIEAFDTSSWYWTSTESSDYWTSTESSSTANGSLVQNFANSDNGWVGKTGVIIARVVRRVPILIDKE